MDHDTAGHIFIYAFGHSHFKQRFQKRRMAELVIRDSNKSQHVVQSQKFES